MNLDGKEELDPSASSDLGADSPSQDETIEAVSPSANDVQDSFSVVRDVVDSKAKTEASSADDGESGSTAEASQVVKEPDNEAFSDVPFSKHPRFRHLVAERNELRTDASSYRNIRSFMDENGVSDEEAADALLVASLVKTNPAKAWEMLRPVVEQVLVAAGEILPAELEARVQAGEIPREAAIQISKSGAQVRSLETRQQFEQRRGQIAAQRDLDGRLVGSATAWERDRQAKDPNYAAKQQALQKEVSWLQRTDGKPKTEAGVKEQLDKAYKAVNESFRAPPVATVRRSAVRLTSTGQGAANTTPRPESTLDIVRAHRRA